jgi:23S rRNA (uracil1939-C5)-methyltransferase
MHLSYPKQLEAKRQKVVDALCRIGKINDCIINECLPSPLPLAYRNKIQLPVREGPSLGLYAKNTHDLISVDHCLIHCELGEEVFQKIKKLLKNSKIDPYDPKTGKGELRHVLIKSGIHTKEVLVVLVTNQKKSPQLTALSHAITLHIPSVKGVIHNLHQEKDNVILGSFYETLEGTSHIQERICDLTFSISAASFFQVNPLQAEKLYLKALEVADVRPDETVLDAYCGVGTLSLIFARRAKEVIGVECVSAAIIDAEENARRNHIQNVSFICSPAEELIHKLPPADILLLNPPRKGCDPLFLEGVKKLSPKKIIYISCDPATLARDLKILQTYGYKVDLVQPFDMFPQTSHVECVAKLSF